MQINFFLDDTAGAALFEALGRVIRKICQRDAAGFWVSPGAEALRAKG